MTKVFKACFTFAIFIGFYFFGYATVAIMQPEQPEQSVSIEELVRAFDEQHEGATPWETCEQGAP